MYHALYRKYRPKDFNSVVGQNSVIKTLKNSIIHCSFSHAYMFFGPRGTGKTSVSKIFARSINCSNSKDGCACGVCECCKSSFSKNCIDIIEIDAASNNGVDEIRELKNRISLVPSELKYKVYIIDEVHMLSIGAFNALLKTLEEPPEHAIFILATTDPQKVPETIVSRCQCFSFKRLSPDVIRNRLDYVCKKESIEIEPEVLNSISLLSDGGLRDALGLLDMLLSYSSGKITMDDFTEVNGIISSEQLNEFIKNVLDGNIVNVLSNIRYFENSGKNLIQIFVQILNHARNLIVDYYLNEKKVDFSIHLLQEFANNLNEKVVEIRRSSNAKIFMEMFFLKFINDYILSSYSDKTNQKKTVEVVQKETSKSALKEEKNVDKIDENAEKKIVNKEVDDLPALKKDINFSDDSDPIVLNLPEIIRVRVNNTLALANKKLLTDEINNFEKLKDFTFDQEIGYIVCSLLDSTVRAVSEENMIISFEYDSNVKQNLLILDKIIDVYYKITNSHKNIAIISDSEWSNYKNEYISNLKNGIKYKIVEEPQQILEETKNNDIITNNAIELFGDIVEIE